MNPITREIYVGFTNDHGIQTISAKQGDTNRKLIIKFIDGLESYVVQDTTYIYWAETFSTGIILPPIKIDKSGLSQDGTELEMKLTNGMCTVGGVSRCEIILYNAAEEPQFDDQGHLINDGDATILTTTEFRLYVEPSVYTDGCLSAQDQQAASELIELVEKADKIIDEMEVIEGKAETAMTAAEAAIQVASEAATNAQTYAEAAATSATNAADSASGASDSATTASTAATEAATSAATATQNASDASDAAQTATDAATAAATSATNASTAAQHAQDEADRVDNIINSLNDRLVITVGNDGHLYWGVSET